MISLYNRQRKRKHRDTVYCPAVLPFWEAAFIALLTGPWWLVKQDFRIGALRHINPYIIGRHSF